MDNPNGSLGEKTRRDKDMHQLEEVELCMIRGSNFPQFSKCSESDENSVIAFVSSS
jgi:hypothetical protein